MVKKAAADDMTCRHCGARVPRASVEMESITQPQPSGPWFHLEVWTCAACGWRSVDKKTERQPA